MINKNYFIFGGIALLLVMMGLIASLPQTEEISENLGIENLESIILNLLDIGEVEDKNISKSNYSESSFNIQRKALVQIEVDENYPCYVEGYDKIVCPAIENETAITSFESKLTPTEKSEFDTIGIPITNVDGDSVEERYLDYTKENIIDVNMTLDSEIKIGFNSNIFIITDLSNGVFNQTEPLGGNVYLETGVLDGNYYTEIIDLNTSRTITNVSWDGDEPDGSDTSMLVRSHNLTNGTGLESGLIAYWNLDSSNFLDFSGNNITGTVVGTTPTVEGKFDNAFEFNGASDYIALGDLDFPVTTTVSFWVKLQSFPNYNRLFVSDSLNTLPFTIGVYNSQIVMASSSDRVRSSHTLVVDEWTMITVVTTSSDVDDMKIYINGADTTVLSTGGFSYSTTTQICGRSNTQSLCDGIIDEVIIYNRSLSSGEVTSLYNQGVLKNWSDWSAEVTTSPAQVSIDDGRYVQVRSEFIRADAGLQANLSVSQITIGHIETGGAPPEVDNPPTVILTIPNNQIFTEVNAILNGTVTDDKDIVNISVWTNVTGSWLLNQTINYTGAPNTSINASFNVSNLVDGKYLWNLQACDNATITQCSFASSNRTFEISTSCIDENCFPYTCDTDFNVCREACTSHDHVNSTYYCGSDGSAQAAIFPVSDCSNLEWLGLTDDEICTSQVVGFCYNDTIGAVGEFCTNDVTGCVESGVEYAQNEFTCIAPNDAYQCLGGESSWSSLIDCRDLGDDYDDSATVPGHEYCGYYNAETCGSGGCEEPNPVTFDCGNYYHVGNGICGGTLPTDAEKRAACDVGCQSGEGFDLRTCNEAGGFILSADCTTCTAPTVNNPPEITLENPANDSTENSLTVNFGYTVVDDFGMANCSLWHNSSGTFEFNQTNSSEVIIEGSTINEFTVIFEDQENILWNIQCYDNESQFGQGNNNFTFTINTSFVDEKSFKLWFDNYSNVKLIVNEEGDMNLSRDLQVDGDLIVEEIISLSGTVDMSQLALSSFLDIDDLSNTGVRLVNPFNDYLRFSGKSEIGSLLLGLPSQNPLFQTETGDYIEFGSPVRFTNGNVTVSNTLIATELVSTTMYVDHINNDGSALYVGGEYGDGGVTIQDGEIFAQNLTLPGGSFTAEGGIINGSFIPAEDSIFDLGNSSLKWRNIFTRDGNFSGELNATNGFFAGNVGIGTATPSKNLQIHHDTDAVLKISEITAPQAPSILFGTSSNKDTDTVGASITGERVNTVTAGDTDLVFSTGVSASITEKMRIMSNGNVGIGTAVPGATLDVEGDVIIGTHNSPLLTFSTDWLDKISITGSGWDVSTGAGFDIILDENANNNLGDTPFRIFSESTSNELFRVSDNGNVGIGTDAPSKLLDIEDSDGTAYASLGAGVSPASLILQDLTNADVTTGNSALQRYVVGGAAGSGIIYSGAVGGGSSSTAEYVIGMRTASGYAERFRIDNTGNVGIGTDDPQYLLHSFSTGHDNRFLLQVGADTGDTAGIYFKSTTAVNTANIKGAVIWEDDGETQARGKLHLAVDIVGDTGSVGVGDAKLTVDSTGFVGIGTVSPDTKLHVNGSITLSGELMGSRHSFILSDNTGATLSNSERFVFAGGVQMHEDKGVLMVRPGSIVGISINYDVTNDQGVDTFDLEILNEGDLVWSNAIDPGSDENKLAYFTQARGIDNFAAGHTLSVRITTTSNVAEEITYDDVIITLEIVYDT